MEFQHCITEGKKAVAEGRMADARMWFSRAAEINPADPEAQLQFALASLLCGDRGAFEAVVSRTGEPSASQHPRAHRLWQTALRFAGCAVAATTLAVSPGCTSSKDSSTTAGRPDSTPAAQTGAQEKTPQDGMDASMNPPPPDDEVYSKHRYSAGVRPPMDVAPEEEKNPPQDGMDASMNPPPPDDEVYSKHRYSAGVRPPADFETEGSMDATPVMQPDMRPSMRPPALKYGVYRRDDL